MASQPMLRLLRSRAPQIRSFTRASPFLEARPSSRALPPMPSFRVKPKAPASPTPNLPKIPTRAPPPPQQHVPPPKPLQHTSRASSPQSYATGLLGDAESLLLYKAPRNIALFVSSFIAGGGLFLWVGDLANDTFLNYTAPWYAKTVVLVGCLVSSAIATAIVTTPHHLIKTISIVRIAEKEAVLRVKGTRFFPFRKQAVFDLVPGELKIDGNVTMSLEDGRRWYGVPLQNAKVWTEGGLQRPDAIEGNAFQKLNQRMLNLGPGLFNQVKKMFNREGMAYVQIKGSNWKMDLQLCEILENGDVLMKLVREAPVRTDLMGMFIQKLGGGKE